MNKSKIRLNDRVLRLLHRKHVPYHLYTVEIPEGVELRVSRFLLWLHSPILGFRVPPLGVSSKTILVHPSTLQWARHGSSLDPLIRHELVHVEQFDRWGVLGTYWRYIQGLLTVGYHRNPLEEEAREPRRVRESGHCVNMGRG